MRVVSVALLIVVAFGSHSAAHAQLSDPIPTPIAQRGCASKSRTSSDCGHTWAARRGLIRDLP